MDAKQFLEERMKVWCSDREKWESENLSYRPSMQKYEVQAVADRNGRPCVVTVYYDNKKEAKKLKKGDIIDGNN